MNVLKELINKHIKVKWKYKSVYFINKISIFNDRSTDDSHDIIMKWISHFNKKGIKTLYSKNYDTFGSCGFAKNRAVAQSHGKYLCFQDADDVMYPDRIAKQVLALEECPNAIVGTYFE